MVAAVTLEQFQGPLDLLLSLIEEEKMVITDIALSRVTEQFFEYLNKLEEKNPAEIADFLVVASKLVFLKSRHLLPYLYPEAEEGPSLADQLKLYQRYADASKVVLRLWERGNVGYPRVEPPPPAGGSAKEFVMPLNATTDRLKDAFVWLLKRLKPMVALPQVAIDRTVSVKQKIESIFQALQKIKKMSFGDVVGRAVNRTEVIVTFLAVLELVKQERVAVEQGSAFGDFVLHRV